MAAVSSTPPGSRRQSPRPEISVVLERFFGRIAGSGDLVLVAFSGGPDSSALLSGLTRVAGGLGLRLHAGHLDHGLDADSPRRAAAAADLAARMEVASTVERLRAPGPGGESPEAFARRHRYAFLERLAGRLGARWIATAHHAGDQAETVLLRLLFGSGLDGLGAMARVRGRVVRPLLGCHRADLRRHLEGTGLEPVADPTNLDLAAPRNAVRARLLPHLEAREPGIAQRLCRLAAAARRANRRIESLLEPCLAPEPFHSLTRRRPRGIAASRRLLESLPAELLSPALALLHRRAGAPYPASSAARRELLRQVRSGGAVGCDCGDGWRWEGSAGRLLLVRGASSPGDFAYNLVVPGSVDIPEIGSTVRLTRGRVAPWMFQGRVDRTGLADDDLAARQVLVRNRRPGDRIRPLGSSRRRLKDLLIDRRIPRSERDRLPLLVVDGEIAWVPGVTIAERFRLGDEPSAWIAEIEKLQASDKSPPSRGRPGDGGWQER